MEAVAICALRKSVYYKKECVGYSERGKRSLKNE
jgi:hypothetical protein